MFLTNTFLEFFSGPLSILQKLSLLLRMLVIALYALSTLVNFQLDLIQNFPNTPSYQTLYYTSQNLATVPITSLIKVPVSKSCPTDFTSLNLTYWPKIQRLSSKGFLKDIPGYTRLLQEGSYEQEEEEKEVINDNFVSISIWKSFRLCAKSMRDFVYIAPNETCSSGFALCSPGLCVSQKEECPITDITFSHIDYTNGPGDFVIHVKRDFDKSPAVMLEVSRSSHLCYKSIGTLNIDTPPEQQCVGFLKDNDSGIIDSQPLSSFLQENTITNTSIDSSALTTKENQVFLVVRKSIKEGKNTPEPDLESFMKKFEKIGDLRTVVTAFAHIEALMFLLLFLLKYKLLINFILLYFILQVILGVSMFVLIQKQDSLKISDTYLFLSHPHITEKDGLHLVIAENKAFFDQVIEALEILSLTITFIGTLRLSIFVVFMKLYWRIWEGDHGNNLNPTRNQDGAGVLLGLYPMAGIEEMPYLPPIISRESREQNRVMEVELEPVNTRNQSRDTHD